MTVINLDQEIARKEAIRVFDSNVMTAVDKLGEVRLLIHHKGLFVSRSMLPMGSARIDLGDEWKTAQWARPLHHDARLCCCGKRP
eukprot:m.205684 g.205684  ORF g.205684 m.205684 type:complete len:85 (-) comp32921_c0_seq27:204-458(-)